MAVTAMFGALVLGLVGLCHAQALCTQPQCVIQAFNSANPTANAAGCNEGPVSAFCNDTSLVSNFIQALPRACVADHGGSGCNDFSAGASWVGTRCQRDVNSILSANTDCAATPTAATTTSTTSIPPPVAQSSTPNPPPETSSIVPASLAPSTPPATPTPSQAPRPPPSISTSGTNKAQSTLTAPTSESLPQAPVASTSTSVPSSKPIPSNRPAPSRVTIRTTELQGSSLTLDISASSEPDSSLPPSQTTSSTTTREPDTTTSSKGFSLSFKTVLQPSLHTTANVTNPPGAAVPAASPTPPAISFPTTPYTGQALLVGTCMTPQYTALPLVDGSIIEVPMIGCGDDRPDCCPSLSSKTSPTTATTSKVARALQSTVVIAALSANPISVCPDDYADLGSVCCPSGFSLYSQAIVGQTPCYTAIANTLPSSAASAELAFISSAAAATASVGATPTVSVSIITDHVFALSLPHTHRSSHLSVSSRIGVGVGAGVGAVLFLLVLVWLLKRRRGRSRIKSSYSSNASTIAAPSPTSAVQSLTYSQKGSYSATGKGEAVASDDMTQPRRPPNWSPYVPIQIPQHADPEWPLNNYHHDNYHENDYAPLHAHWLPPIQPSEPMYTPGVAAPERSHWAGT